MLKSGLKGAFLASAMAAAATTGVRAADAGESDRLLPESLTASIAFTTDYRFRGVTQTQSDAAIQAGLTWTHPTGFYVGVWGSNIKFADGDKADLEIDTFFGFTNTLGKFSYDVGGIRYNYPGSKPANIGGGKYHYWEAYFSPSYDLGIASLKASVYYSPEFFGETGDALYYRGAVAVPLPFLPYNAKLDAWGGYSEFLDRGEAAFTPTADYWDWSLGLGFTVVGFGLDFRYTDTSLKDTAAIPFSSSDVAGSRFVFTFSRAF